MCGIAGFVDRAGKVNAEALNAANRAIAHRGPDDAGALIIPMQNHRGHVGLANRRLAILDLSPAGHQPMFDPDTGNSIAYNGEVFNFRELRRELELKGARFSSHTDTEVVLKAYAVWGEGCLDRFRGMFAFAIWDAHQERLFVARDRLGKKPLYYYEGNGFFLFASEVRALLATGLVPQAIDAVGLQQFVRFGSVYDPHTFIDGVRSVPAGCYLTWKNDHAELREYWDMAAVQPQDQQNEAEVLPKLRSLLDESLSLRMISDVPVGVFLSGGIDSSAVVALLGGIQQQKINTFSIVFKDIDYSEAEFSRIVARRFRTEHHEIELTARDFIASVPDAIKAMDQPSVDGFNTYFISRAVRCTGLKVALSGQGGDELFGGYTSFRTVPRMEKFLRAYKMVPDPLKSTLSSLLVKASRNDRLRKVGALAAGTEDLVHPYFLTRMMFVPEEQRRLLSAQQVPVDATQELATMVSRSQHFDPINRVSYLELRNYIGNTLLRDGDCMSMANGLEVRLPFLDHRLVEYVLSIPGCMKLDRNTPKHLLVKAMGGVLPPEIVYRPKQGFTFPFENWLREELKSDVEGVLKRIEGGPLANFLNPNAVREIWQSFLQGTTSWARPWTLYVIERWCQQNLTTVHETESAFV
jgi:asparagine synthase (glutamine-hydrolysing)